jgi:hypothetical protein
MAQQLDPNAQAALDAFIADIEQNERDPVYRYGTTIASRVCGNRIVHVHSIDGVYHNETRIAEIPSGMQVLHAMISPNGRYVCILHLVEQVVHAHLVNATGAAVGFTTQLPAERLFFLEAQLLNDGTLVYLHNLHSLIVVVQRFLHSATATLFFPVIPPADMRGRSALRIAAVGDFMRVRVVVAVEHEGEATVDNQGECIVVATATLRPPARRYATQSEYLQAPYGTGHVDMFGIGLDLVQGSQPEQWIVCTTDQDVDGRGGYARVYTNEGTLLTFEPEHPHGFVRDIFRVPGGYAVHADHGIFLYDDEGVYMCEMHCRLPWSRLEFADGNLWLLSIPRDERHAPYTARHLARPTVTPIRSLLALIIASRRLRRLQRLPRMPAEIFRLLFDVFIMQTEN